MAKHWTDIFSYLTGAIKISIYSIAEIKPVKMVGEPVFCISLIDANSLTFAS
ncbi:hypothetical protein SAMN05428988_4027 [Chitinophaga sp. YR573]|uniref:hypothetical protein n=1 Tax=Chitinophaga sp. YR573 TaxID=1881040 RepID=UPI0008CFFD74|nr:hypothetical protein [Chitinophaga sp. YR573]SEW29077.1 hypothetical protein SAMN05428988_4027 [Chitinophaga sp. YR573]